MVLSNWQFVYNIVNEYGNTESLTFGGSTSFQVKSVTGLDTVDSRVESLMKVQDHGAFSDAQFLEARTIEISGDVTAVDDATFVTNITSLRKFFGNPRKLGNATGDFMWHRQYPFLQFLQAGDITKRVMCVRTRFHWLVDPMYALRYGEWVVQFVAEDPRIYDDSETILSLTAASASGTPNNNGTIDVFPYINITGPFNSGVKITYSGGSLGKNGGWQFNQAVAAGHRIVVDHARRTVVDDAGVNQYSKLVAATTGQAVFFPLTPTSESSSPTIALTGAGTTGASRVDISYRSGWN